MGVLDGFEAKFEVVKLEASNVVHLGLREALRTQLVFCRPDVEEAIRESMYQNPMNIWVFSKASKSFRIF